MTRITNDKLEIFKLNKPFSCNRNKEQNKKKGNKRNFEFQSGMYCPIYYTNTNKIPNNFTSARKGVTYYVTIATVIFSYVKVCYFLVLSFRAVTWYKSCAVGLPKQRQAKVDWYELDWFRSPTVQCVLASVTFYHVTGSCKEPIALVFI